jgi:hypothetical protein
MNVGPALFIQCQEHTSKAMPSQGLNRILVSDLIPSGYAGFRKNLRLFLVSETIPSVVMFFV